MSAPIPAGDLVADQRVAGRGIGNAQQGLGKAHQRHAFLARQRIFVDQALDPPARAVPPQGFDELPRQPGDTSGALGGQTRVDQ